MIYKTRTDIETLTDRLTDRSLPKPEWTHAAHLTAGFCLLHRYGLEVSIRDMPKVIRAYNEATNTPNTDHEGYHHTLTLFYLKAIDLYIKSLVKDYDFIKACHDLINGEIGAKQYPFEYYSRELLFSLKARHQWVEPDLQCL